MPKVRINQETARRCQGWCNIGADACKDIWCKQQHQMKVVTNDGTSSWDSWQASDKRFALRLLCPFLEGGWGKTRSCWMFWRSSMNVLEKQHALINMKHEVKWDGGWITPHALWPFWLQAEPKVYRGIKSSHPPCPFWIVVQHWRRCLQRHLVQTTAPNEGGDQWWNQLMG